MQYEALKRKINEHEGGMKRAAENIGVSAETLGLKLSGGLPMYAFEVQSLCDFLGINTLSEKLYFFYPQRPRNGTKEKKGGKALRFLHKNGKRKNLSE